MIIFTVGSERTEKHQTKVFPKFVALSKRTLLCSQQSLCYDHI